MISPFIYFKRNPKNPILIISISSLAVLVISLTVAIISSIQISTATVVIDQFKGYSVAIYKGEDGDAQELLEEEIKDVDLYQVNIDYTNFNTAFGTNSAFLYSFGDEDSLKKVFEECQMKLIAGRMPEFGSSEIILHESILQNKGLSIGEKIGSKLIVGTMSGDYIVGYGYSSDEEIEQAGYLAPSFMIFAEEGSVADIRVKLDNFDTNQWQTFTYTAMSKELADEMSTINLIMILIVMMIVSCLSIAVSALIYTIYSNRYDEFAILNAIGYKKSTIRLLIVLEIVSLALFSWILGYVLSLLGMVIVNKTIYQDLGQQMPLFTSKGFCYSILLPIVSILFAVIPVSRKLSKTDLIGIIERR